MWRISSCRRKPRCGGLAVQPNVATLMLRKVRNLGVVMRGPRDEESSMVCEVFSEPSQRGVLLGIAATIPCPRGCIQKRSSTTHTH